MPRPPRFSYPRAVHHVTLRCNNREFLFAPASQSLFLEVLQRARAKFPVQLYNYCLMTNHVHLLFKVGHADTLSEVMHWISTSFSRRFNKQAGRHGHLWEGRFRSTIIEQDSYFFRSMAYLDLNPVRAGMVSSPLDYQWSAHQALRDEEESVLDFHTLYLGLGPDRRSRYAAYTKLLAEEAQRRPVSLATTYFVGTAAFVDRMVEKFQLDGPSTSLERTELDSKIICAGAHVGDVAKSLLTPAS